MTINVQKEMIADLPEEVYGTGLRYDYSGVLPVAATIDSNTFTNCAQGIVVSGNNSLTQATMGNNTLVNCGDGISLVGGSTTQVAISNNMVLGSSGVAIHVESVASSSVLQNNTIRNSGIGLEFENCSPVVQNNLLSNLSGYPYHQIGQAYPAYSGNTLTSNVQRVIAVEGAITGNATWPLVSGMVYLVTANVTVSGGVTLTIEPGVVVKFEYQSSSTGKRLLLVNGVLNAQGGSGSPIIFTSERDDDPAHGRCRRCR